MGWISGLNTITIKLAWRLPDNDGNDDKCIVSVSRAITDARMIMDMYYMGLMSSMGLLSHTKLVIACGSCSDLEKKRSSNSTSLLQWSLFDPTHTAICFENVTQKSRHILKSFVAP